MIKIEPNMYVRTNKGIIDKIDNKNIMIYEVSLMGFGEKPIKASHNIIDLIEVDDYVNGKKVIRKWEEPFGEFVGQIFIKLDGEETIPTLRKIETIVTKEQFESMSYKVERG
jgi:hypothetical protein